MNLSSWRWPAAGGLFYSLTACLVAVAFTRAQADDRKAWRYEPAAGVVTIVHVGGKTWDARRPDDRRATYEEVARTDEHVVLHNRESKLLLKLTADRGYWRRDSETDNDWRAWEKGAWVSIEAPAPSPSPAAAPQAADTGRIRLAYFVPSDRQPLKNYETKIRVLMAYVADLYRVDLLSKGYKTAGLSFAQTSDGQPQVHLLRGSKAASHYNNAPQYDANEQWRRLASEVRASLGSTDTQIIVVFAETYDDGPAKFTWPGVIARGAYYNADGGLAIYTSHILRDEFCATDPMEQRKLFFDETPIRGRTAMGHGRPNSPRFEFVEDGFGAVAHELGHALGLPHDRRLDSVYIMGNGFRNLRRNFGAASRQLPVRFSDESAMLLMSSRYVADDLNLQDAAAPQVQMTLTYRPGGGVIASVQVADDVGLRAAVFVDRNAGSIVEGRKLTGKAQRFQIAIAKPAVQAGQISIQLIVTDDGGHQTRVAQIVRVGAAAGK